MKRVFLIVLDSFGIGALPDARLFGDEGANTLASVAETGFLKVPNMVSLGLADIDGITVLTSNASPKGAYGRLRELSNGKDTTVGHYEIAGIISSKPFRTYKNGFPKEIIDEFSRKTGRKVLCNKPYSGTEVIKDYGEEHLKTGDLIVYTSADSVFQIAANESIVSREELYEYCLAARRILVGDNAVARVIARPFEGTNKDNFKRTDGRRDFSLPPPKKTMLDMIKDAGLEGISVGKIRDIFSGVGITEAYPSHSNKEGMEITASLCRKDFEGLVFVNLVDFDSSFGHRNDSAGYAAALSEFDLWLGEFIPMLKEEDILIITADHGCDPGDVSTDHTREYVPILIYGENIIPKNLGTKDCLGSIAASVTDYLGVPYSGEGKSFLDEFKGSRYENL